MQRSTIREILKLTGQPDVISFAGGLPAPEFFPVERVREVVDLILAERGQSALQYSTSEGLPELRQLIAERMSDPNLEVAPENILITTGSQQALDLLGRVLINDGDPVIVENPTYLGALMAWRPYAVNYLPVDTDEHGLALDQLPALLRQQPALMYVVPNFQNPGGTTLPLDRRRQLIDMLASDQIPLIEDNPYGELRFDGQVQPSLISLDAARRGVTDLEGMVVSVGSFSKILAPGLRLGWIAASPILIDKLVQAKQLTDLHTSTLDQLIVSEVARDGYLDRHVQQLCTVYRERRDVRLAAMQRYFPPEVTWTRPEGGLFLFVTAPDYIDSAAMLSEAVKRKVAFVPGAAFYVNGQGHNTFRLNFSNARPAMIEAGIQRLGDLLKEMIVQPVI